MRRNRKRKPVDREERSSPTPQTAAKLLPDPLQLMLAGDEVRESRCGKASIEEAAEEIRAVYMAVTRAVMCKLASLEGRGGRGADIPEALAHAHLHTYMPWANHWTHSRVLEAVIDVVVDRYQRPPATYAVIVMALADYAKRMRERAPMVRAA